MPTRTSDVRTHLSDTNVVENQNGSAVTLDPEEAASRLLRDLRRLRQHRPNALRRQRKRRWPAELARQFTHPLALLLWLAAGLLLLVGSNIVAAAVVLIIGLNAAFSFVRELQAERAVEALAKFMSYLLRRSGQKGVADREAGAA